MDTSSVKIISKGPTNRDSANTELPHISQNLVDYLHKVYQDNVPNVGMSDREIWVEVGKISVVRHIQDLYNQQNEQT